MKMIAKNISNNSVCAYIKTAPWDYHKGKKKYDRCPMKLRKMITECSEYSVKLNNTKTIFHFYFISINRDGMAGHTFLLLGWSISLVGGWPFATTPPPAGFLAAISSRSFSFSEFVWALIMLRLCWLNLWEGIAYFSCSKTSITKQFLYTGHVQQWHRLYTINVWSTLCITYTFHGLGGEVHKSGYYVCVSLSFLISFSLQRPKVQTP